MQILIITLIIVLIAQTCVFIYANFIERLAAASQQMVASAQEAFLSEKKRMQEQQHLTSQSVSPSQQS